MVPLLPQPLNFNVQYQYVCKPEYDPLFRSWPVQERAHWRHRPNEVMAVVELDRNLFTLRAIHAPREVGLLRSYIKKRMPYPYPTGAYNFLNHKFIGFTLLHGSAKQLKYDIVDLLLTYGADVNIKEDGNTLAHNAAELNDALLLDVINSYSADFKLLNRDDEPALMVAIALGNEEAIQFIWSVAEIHTQAENHETVLHYAARHKNPVIAQQGCVPRYQISRHTSCVQHYTSPYSSRTWK